MWTSLMVYDYPDPPYENDYERSDYDDFFEDYDTDEAYEERRDGLA